MIVRTSLSLFTAVILGLVVSSAAEAIPQPYLAYKLQRKIRESDRLLVWTLPDTVDAPRNSAEPAQRVIALGTETSAHSIKINETFYAEEAGYDVPTSDGSTQFHRTITTKISTPQGPSKILFQIDTTDSQLKFCNRTETSFHKMSLTRLKPLYFALPAHFQKVELGLQPHATPSHIQFYQSAVNLIVRGNHTGRAGVGYTDRSPDTSVTRYHLYALEPAYLTDGNSKESEASGWRLIFWLKGTAEESRVVYRAPSITQDKSPREFYSPLMTPPEVAQPVDQKLAAFSHPPVIALPFNGRVPAHLSQTIDLRRFLHHSLADLNQSYRWGIPPQTCHTIIESLGLVARYM